MTSPFQALTHLTRLHTLLGVEPSNSRLPLLEKIEALFNANVIDRRHFITLSSLIQEGDFVTSVNLLYPIAFPQEAIKIWDSLDYSNKLDALKMAKHQGLFFGFKDRFTMPPPENFIPYAKLIKELSQTLSSYQVETLTPPPHFNKPVVLTSSLNWEHLEHYDPGKALFTLRMVTNHLSANRTIARDYLAYLTAKHYQELCQPYRECRKSNLLMEIAYLDRLLNEGSGAYVTPLAKTQLDRWMNEKTGRGIDHNLNEYIFDQNAARTFFTRYPKTYDWIIETRLHRAASTFNHRWLADENGDLLIPTAEGPKPATSLMQSIQLINDRLTDLNTGQLLSYQPHGLDKLDGALAPFKIKDRKTKDWRLELASDTGEDEEGHEHIHSYAYLKSPDGKVFSIGKLPDNDIDGLMVLNNSFQTQPGYLKMGDISDFLGRKKSNKWPKTNIKVTKIDLGSEENFLKALDFIKSYQGDFNLIDNNCGSLPIGLSNLFNIHPKSKVAIPSLLTPLSLDQRKFLVIHSWIQTISLILFYPIIVLSHIAIAVLGGMSKHPFSKGKPLFTHIFEIFDPTKSLINYPYQFRAWQEVVEERLGKGVYTLEQMRGC